jgi:hypothetical protein
MNSSDLIKAVNAVLTRLISPKLNGMVNYEVTTETHDDTGELYVIVDVIVDIVNYWKIYHNGDYNNGEGYNSPSDFDDDIVRDVKQALKYLGIQKSIVEIYVIES